MTMFNIKLISSNQGIFQVKLVIVRGSLEKPAIARIFNLGKFRAIGRVPRVNPCYSMENAEIFITVWSVSGLSIFGSLYLVRKEQC